MTLSVPLETSVTTPGREHLRALAERRFERSIARCTRFFDDHADVVPRACLAMARRFERGGRLLVFGAGAALTDARHVSVEFVHPVLVGKRALPAMVVPAPGVETNAALQVLGRADDIALWIASHDDEAGRRALGHARGHGMLTIALEGGWAAAIDDRPADFVFRVPDDDPFVVQEVHETLYHVLWELVHVFLEPRIPGAARP